MSWLRLNLAEAKTENPHKPPALRGVCQGIIWSHLLYLYRSFQTRNIKRLNCT